MSRLIKLLDTLNETSLFEMAYQRKFVVNKIRELQWKIFDHLVKIVSSTADETKNHWASEINTWLQYLQRLKLKNQKYLTEGDWLTLLWKEPAEDDPDIIRRVWVSFDELNRNKLSDRQVWEQLRSIYSYICNDLSKSQFTKIQKYIDISYANKLAVDISAATEKV